MSTLITYHNDLQSFLLLKLNFKKCVISKLSSPNPDLIFVQTHLADKNAFSDSTLARQTVFKNW